AVQTCRCRELVFRRPLILDNGANSRHQLRRYVLDLVDRSHVLDGPDHQLAFVLLLENGMASGHDRPAFEDFGHVHLPEQWRHAFCMVDEDGLDQVQFFRTAAGSARDGNDPLVSRRLVAIAPIVISLTRSWRWCERATLHLPLP